METWTDVTVVSMMIITFISFIVYPLVRESWIDVKTDFDTEEIMSWIFPSIVVIIYVSGVIMVVVGFVVVASRVFS